MKTHEEKVIQKVTKCFHCEKIPNSICRESQGHKQTVGGVVFMDEKKDTILIVKNKWTRMGMNVFLHAIQEIETEAVLNLLPEISDKGIRRLVNFDMWIAEDDLKPYVRFVKCIPKLTKEEIELIHKESLEHLLNLAPHEWKKSFTCMDLEIGNKNFAMFLKQADRLCKLVPSDGSGVNWSLPKGMLPKGMDSREGAKKEVEEETGILVNFDLTIFSKGKGAQWFSCTLDKEKLSSIRLDDNQSWIPDLSDDQKKEVERCRFIHVRQVALFLPPNQCELFSSTKRVNFY